LTRGGKLIRLSRGNNHFHLIAERSKANQKAAGNYLKKLSTDHKAREEFKRDPHGAMDKAGISPETKAILKSGDPDKIRQHLGDDAPPGCFVILAI
jgi:hypothetical protein